jgi:hypothetical protein
MTHFNCIFHKFASACPKEGVTLHFLLQQVFKGTQNFTGNTLCTTLQSRSVQTRGNQRLVVGGGSLSSSNF